MSTPYFRFKQFTIFHDRCAMKVGTDGVLLGCWAGANHAPFGHLPCTILDVGTGSGLIARMLMQRFPEAEVGGIDIDEAAVEQARGNGVNAYLSSLQEWQNHKPQITNHKYDLVVSNPPYFQNSLKNPDKGRELARHTDSLSYEELLSHSERLLTMHGQLAIDTPYISRTLRAYIVRSQNHPVGSYYNSRNRNHRITESQNHARSKTRSFSKTTKAAVLRRIRN